jgi:hypothetical protein
MEVSLALEAAPMWVSPTQQVLLYAFGWITDRPWVQSSINIQQSRQILDFIYVL